MKKRTLQIGGLIVIGIMFFSTIAFAGIQGIFQTQAGTAHGAQQQVALPTQSVLTERMSPAQFNYAIQRGIAVATYKYDPTNVQTQAEIQFLEELVFSQQFVGQIILEEVEQSGPSELEITSFIGTTTVDDLNGDDIFKAFCDFVANPPLACTGL